jgi:Uma2 family endonuclease
MADLSVREERESYLTKHRLTVDEFHRMGETGVLPADVRIELLEGELIEMPPIGPAHANEVDHLNALFAPLTGRLIVRVQNPISLGLRSELVPDLMLLKPRPGGYPTAAPGPSDVLLLIEVADTTLRVDRDEKIPLYGKHGVAESWLLDLGARRLEIYEEPGPDGYKVIRRPSSDDVIAASLLPDHQLTVRDLFAP